ncbi:receptor-transporting protein 3-like [Platichthys flesus]|uniref:receptor-transporting protein 3-like n=1 Tax=Platichthys flesus TaxID=8260 RepID=UPI001A7F8AEA|nr:receptor-transporting protein 3-like [Platichthys flesus]
MDLGMWRSTFKKAAKDLQRGDTWNLEFDSNIDPRCLQPGWKEYIRRTSAWFKCSLCRRDWSSDRVMVVFHMRLEGSTGTVKVRRLRQSCNRCSDARMEDPTVEMENLRNLMESLVMKIGMNCYNETNPKGGEYVQKKPDNTRPHEPAHCEGCKLGFCTNE